MSKRGALQLWCLAWVLACHPTPETATTIARDVRPQPTAAPSATSAPASPNTTATDADVSVPTSTPSSTLAPPVTEPTIDLSGIDELVAQAIADHLLPGCVVTIGNRDGVLFQRAYGQRAVLPASEPMTLDTRFDLASLTKSVATSIAVMQLVESGKLTLDTKAATLLPELNAGPGARQKRNITVRQLMLHTSGLPAVTPLKDYEQPRDKAIATMLRAKPVTAPGARFGYSDVGFIALGEIVARVSGQALDRYVYEQVYARLGMTRTGYLLDPALHAEAAPQERGNGRGVEWIRGHVHDPRAFRLGGVAGNAGVFTTADDLSRLARALLNGGNLGEHTVLSPQAVARMTEPHLIGDEVRALGWDMRSRYSKNGGNLLSPIAYGHGGFTGTSLWIDPRHDLFVIVLSNRLHPDGAGNVIHLAGAIANHAVTAVTRSRTTITTTADAATQHTIVRTGIDRLRASEFTALRGKRVGLVTNHSARARDGISTLELFKRSDAFTLRAVFTPEHGISADHEGHVADDRSQNVPVFSLFGAQRKPTAEMLDGVDTLVFDLQDVGVRFYTYASTLVQVLEAAREHGLHVVVLDRPNPLGGVVVEGPLQDASVNTFVNYHRLPVRHGMTIGELARLLNVERDIHASLEVIELEGWRREQGFEDTGLTWIAPSPNLRTPSQAWLYPALGLLESTNVTVGRGTDVPFEVVGAPWLDATAMAAALRSQWPDMHFSPMEVTPTIGPHRGQPCRVVHIRIGDQTRYAPVRLALSIAQHLARHHREWNLPELHRMLAHRETLNRLRTATDLTELESLWTDDLRAFTQRRELFLLYR